MKCPRRFTSSLLAVSALAVGAGVSACTPPAPNCGFVASAPTTTSNGYVTFQFSNACPHPTTTAAIERVRNWLPTTVATQDLYPSMMTVNVYANMCTFGWGDYRGRFVVDGTIYHTSTLTLTSAQTLPFCM